MKITFSALLITFLFLMGCQPKDNKLPFVGSNRSSGGPTTQSAKGLRVGSYGQPIFAAQNLEQVGSLIEFCLASDDDEMVEKTIGEKKTLLKNCNVKQMAGSVYEKWNVSVYVDLEKNESGEHELLSASGSLQKASGSALYKSLSMDIEYHDKDFSFSVSAQNQIKVRATSFAAVKSSGEALTFTSSLTAEGVLENNNWKIQKLDYAMTANNKLYSVKSSDITLAWNGVCADFSGTATTNDGRYTDEITLSPAKAELIVKKATVRPWSQEYPDCSKRTTSIQNFEFLFY